MAKILLLLSCLLTVGVWPSGGVAAPDPSGRWVVNEDDSDDSHERMQGLTVIRSRSKSLTEAQRDREGLNRQSAVYDEIQLAKERRAIKQEANVGDLNSVLHTQTLAIEPIDGGYTVTYDGGFRRTLKPRPGGPRYSAKGDEFVPDEIGRSMVYWRGSQLVVETLLAPRGTMTEEISVTSTPRRITVHTVLRNPDWLINGDLIRRFDPAP